MNKLQMAHQMACAMIASNDGYTVNGAIECAWQYADAMQAEADNRDIYKGIPRNACGGIDWDKWQPDWNQAPDWANYWCMQAYSGWCYWTESQPAKKWDKFAIIRNESAPTFGYAGDWRNSLRKRPE